MCLCEMAQRTQIVGGLLANNRQQKMFILWNIFCVCVLCVCLSWIKLTHRIYRSMFITRTSAGTTEQLKNNKFFERLKICFDGSEQYVLFYVAHLERICVKFKCTAWSLMAHFSISHVFCHRVLMWTEKRHCFTQNFQIVPKFHQMDQASTNYDTFSKWIQIKIKYYRVSTRCWRVNYEYLDKKFTWKIQQFNTTLKHIHSNLE